MPRNSNIPEELGRVHYLLSDKTGTLTKNEMYLKRVGVYDTQYNFDDPSSLRSFRELSNRSQ